MAQVIEAPQRPALILAPNKTLAAQLYGEFKSFFPNNAVEYFVSYYDYYQPEAYIPRTDTYIEKDSSINEQIDRMRHAATRALLERDDVIIVASVSCIYGIGAAETYTAMTFELKAASGCSSASCSPTSSPCNTAATTEFRPRHLPGARRHRSRSSRRTMKTAPGASRCSATRSRHHRVRSAHRREDHRARLRQALRQHALCDAEADAATRRSRASRRSCSGGWTSSTPRAGSSKRSAWSSAPISTSR